MISLDGKTLCENKFSGPTGKALLNANDIRFSDTIPSLGIDIDISQLDDRIVSTLSGDQRYLFEITNCIKIVHCLIMSNLLILALILTHVGSTLPVKYVNYGAQIMSCQMNHLSL